jgi:hypothetical protein
MEQIILLDIPLYMFVCGQFLREVWNHMIK